jgi:hypothetical protein
MANDEAENLSRLSVFLRVYGALSLVIFGSLFLGFAVETPLLADEPRGALNWLIWNGVRCGSEPCHVPPMLFVIYLAWAVFFFLAARKPLAYGSFLSFTMWANLSHGGIMIVQAVMHLLTDIPFVLILSLGIYLWRPSAREDTRQPSALTA